MKRMMMLVVLSIVAELITAGAYPLFAADAPSPVSADMSAIFQTASGDTAETRAPQYPFPAQGQGAPYAYPGTPAQPGTVQQIPQPGTQTPQYPAAPGFSSIDGSWVASVPNGGQIMIQFQGSQYQMSMNGGMDSGTYQIQGNMITFQSSLGGVTQFAFTPSPNGLSFQMSPPQNPQVGFLFQRTDAASVPQVPYPQVSNPAQNPASYPAPPAVNTPPVPQQQLSLDGTWMITLNGQTRYIAILGKIITYFDANGNTTNSSTFYTQGSAWYETMPDGRQISSQFQLSPDGRTLTLILDNGQTGTYQRVQ